MALIRINNRSSEDNAIHGRRNILINGNFDVWQRGTTATYNTLSSRFIVDRWMMRSTGAATVTTSQQSFTLGQTDVPNNPKYYHRWDITSYTSGNGLFHQRIEGVAKNSGQNLTLTFWAKCNSSQNLITSYRQYFGSSGSSDVDTSGSTFALTTSWQKFTETVTIPSVSGKTISGGNDYLYLQFNLPGAVCTVDIAQVQLEVGDIATPFEHRSYAEELSLCSRFYHTSFSGETTISGSHPANYAGKVFSWCDQYGSSPDRVAFNYQWPVQMRDIPTVTMYGNQWTSARMSKYNGGSAEYTIDYASGVSRNGLGGYYDVAGTNGDFVVAYVEASAEL